MNIELIENNRKKEVEEYKAKILLRSMYANSSLVFHDDENSIQKHSNRCYFSPEDSERQRFLCKLCCSYWKIGGSCKCGRSGSSPGCEVIMFTGKYETRLFAPRSLVQQTPRVLESLDQQKK